MAGSLKDQMLQLGLISKEQAARPKGKKAKKPKAQRGQKSQRQQELEALAAHKREQDRAANRERELQKKAREQADWVRQVISTHAIRRDPPGDDANPFNFTLDGKVHRLHAQPALRRRLAAGELGIAHFDGHYHVVPKAQAQRLAEKIPRRTWVPVDDDKPDADDPYAGYEVPDDLIW